MNNRRSTGFGILLSSVGFIVFFINIYSFYIKNGYISYINNLNLITLGASGLVLISSFHRIGILVQITCLSFTGFITYHQDPTNAMSTLQFILVFVIAYKYGFLERYLLTKIALFLLLLLIILFSTLVSGRNTILQISPTVVFLLFFIFSLYLILKDEIIKHIKHEKALKKEISELKLSLQFTRMNLEKTQYALDSIKNDYIDPQEAGLTDIEMTLLENLCMYRETNNDLGFRLNKSPHTIKVQLAKIMIKIGADNRYQLIDLCRNYFEVIKEKESVKNIPTDSD